MNKDCQNCGVKKCEYRFTSIYDSKYKHELDEVGNCKYYKRIWWKFWARR